VLAYGAGASGWTDELTSLHEHAAGSDHFIDVASRRHALEEAARAHGDHETVVLEIGSSSGYLLAELVRRLPRAFVIGADYTYGTLERVASRLPRVPLLQFDLVNCPLPDASIDTVILLNVLEHIERDDLAVRQLHRILRPNGIAIIEVPAGPGTYDSYDKALMHFRRYRMSGLIRMLRAAGFDIERRSHLAFALYPGFWIAKTLQRARGTAGRNLERHVASSISWSSRFHAIAAWLLALEASARRFVYLPFGIRCLVTCRKPA